jgi:hypothetical protein
MSMLGLFGPLFYLTSTFADSEWVAVAGIFDAEPPSASIPKKPRWRCWIGVVEDYREPKTPSHHKASANILNGVGVRWCYGAIGWTTIDANEFPAVLFRRIRRDDRAYSRHASQEWIKQWLCRFPERTSAQRSACARKTYVSLHCSAGCR